MKSFIKLFVTLFVSFSFFGCASNLVSSDSKERADLYFNLGNAYTELEKFDDAAKAYVEAYRLDNSFAAAGYNLIRVYIELKKFDEAELLLKRMLDEEPRNIIILEAAGYLYHLRGDYQEALRYYNRVLTADEVNSNALYNSYLIYREEDDLDMALKQLEKYLESNFNDTPSIAELASLLYQQGEVDFAIEQYQFFLEKEKTDSEEILRVKKVLIEIYLDLKQFSEALVLLDTLDNEEEPDPAVIFDKAWATLIGLEEYKEGIDLLNEAIEAGFNDIKRATQMAMVKEALHHDEILEFMKEKKLYDPDSLIEEAPEGDPDSEKVVDEKSTESDSVDSTDGDSKTNGEPLVPAVKEDTL